MRTLAGRLCYLYMSKTRSVRRGDTAEAVRVQKPCEGVAALCVAVSTLPILGDVCNKPDDDVRCFSAGLESHG